MMPAVLGSKKALIGAVAGAILLAIGGYLLLKDSAGSQQSVQIGGATATTLKTMLSVTPKGTLTPEEIPTSKQVKEGDKLSTSKDGRGIIEMDDGSTAVLDYSSEVTISSLGSSKTSVALKTGSVWAQVKKVLGQGEFFEIKTQNAVAVVRGTSFGLTYHADGSSTLFVDEGVVRFVPVNPATGEPDYTKAKEVSAGDKAMLSSTGVFTEAKMSLAERNNEWVTFNTGKLGETLSPTPVRVETETKVTPTTAPTPEPKTETTDSNTSSNTNSNETAPTSSGSGNACGSFSETGGYTSGNSGSLKLASVSPTSVSRSGGATITLSGTGFVCVTTVTIGGTVLNGENGFVVVDNSKITLSASALAVGTFDVVMADTLGNVAGLPRALTVER